ncbi:MAG: hypothetical protein VW268_02890 [Rhodospirillaceae bacterium]
MINDQTPVYIDLHGGGKLPGDEPPEPLIPRCWHGRERLWVVFWAYGLFGSGLVTGVGLAMIFIAPLIGLVIDPAQTGGGIIGAVIGMAGAAVIAVPYVIWMTVSLWRCAHNTFNPLWGRLTRGWVIVFWLGIAIAGYNYLAKHLA